MLNIVAFLLKLVGLGDWFEHWMQERQRQKEIQNAVEPYKKEAEIYAAPQHSRHDNIERMRESRDR